MLITLLITFFEKSEKSEKKFYHLKKIVYIYISLIIKTNNMLIQVQTKARKHYPSVATKYSVDLERNKSIKIFVNGVQTNSFNIGDTAEYDSYNLIYTGRITKITDKLVQITAYPGTQNERKHNLNLNTFCWRNEKFDAEQVAKHNQEESYYI